MRIGIWATGLTKLAKYVSLSVALVHDHGSVRSGWKRLLLKFCNQVKAKTGKLLHGYRYIKA